ncbi:hypothetical protein [Limnohabitans sp. 2KL-1]|uniref:hypothetical protein n=1 Tax=Limnohabitans sp. 2KL-1 TaxID=1100699 RepID=UPI001304A6A2|nr:hypothetical protein [Limnohabitans sp. 2KL-1]
MGQRMGQRMCKLKRRFQRKLKRKSKHKLKRTTTLVQDGVSVVSTWCGLVPTDKTKQGPR